MRSTLPLTNRFCSQIIFSRYLNSSKHSKLGWMEADILQTPDNWEEKNWIVNEDCSQDADCYVAFIIVIFRSLTTLNRANCRVNSPHRTTNVRQQQSDIWRMLLYLFIVPFLYLRSAAAIQSYPRTTDIYSCLQLSKHLRGHSTESLAPSTDFPLCILHSPPHYRHSSLELWHTTSS